MEDIKTLLLEYGLEGSIAAVLLRESADNFVYLVGEEKKKILRISKRLPIEDIQFEYDANQYLSKKSNLFSRWIKTTSGSPYALLGDKVAVMFEFIDGKNIEIDKDHLPELDVAYAAGKGLGEMRNAAVGFSQKSPRNRTIFSELERVLLIADKFKKEFEGGEKFVSEVESAIEFGKNKKEDVGLIHNDYRPGNVLFNDSGEVTGVIDFDWSCSGPLIKDLALAVVEWSFPDGAEKADFRIFDAFLDGYNSIAEVKIEKDENLYSWIRFAVLSDAATYFCDLAEDPNSEKRVIRSYMYRKYNFFSSL